MAAKTIDRGAHEREVTLDYGRVVSNFSPEFLLWCEAGAVCAMRSRTARRAYVERVEKRRGAAAAHALKAAVLARWGQAVA